MSFFHDGQVGREISVEHFVETEPAQRCDHLARDNRTAVHAERFAERHPGRRRSLHDDVLRRVADGSPDRLGIVLFHDGRRRAYAGALPAIGAGSEFQPHFKRRRHHGVKTAFGKTIDIDALPVATGFNAAAAQNAFVRIAHQGRIVGVERQILLHAVETDLPNPHICRNSLQFTVGIALARQAILRMIRQQ